MRVKWWLAVLFWMLASIPAFAQHWMFQQYGPDAGLTNPNILAIHQDHEGFLWVSTEGGLFRYDGDRFRPYAVRLPGNAASVTSLYSSPGGQLWAGSSAGLFRWLGDRFAPVPGFSGVEIQPGQSISSDGSTIYVASESGLWSLRELGDAKPVRLAAVRATSVFVDQHRTVWFGCSDGLCSQRPGHQMEEYKSGTLPAGPWNSIVEDSRGNLWIRSPDRVMVREAAAGKFREIARLVWTHSAVMFPTKAGEVLIPHTAGLAICRAEGCRNYGTESGLERAEVLAVIEDREGSIWIGYSGHGLARWLGRKQWESFGSIEGLDDPQIWRIAHDAAGNVWAGTNSGVFIGSIRDGRWKFRRVNALGTGVVYGLALDPDGSVWMGTYRSGPNGLVHYNPRTGRKMLYAPDSSVARLNVNSLSRGPDGTIWVGTPKGVFSLKPGGRHLEALPLPLSGASVYDIRTIAGVTYICGRKGLYIQRNGIGQLLTVADGLKENAIQSVAMDSAGALWIAYYSPLGLSRLDWQGGKPQIHHYTTADGLPSDVVYLQFFDARGNHWIGTDNGAALLQDGLWTQYNTLNGLVWNDCNAGAFMTETNGVVWIGTSSGMSRFSPAAHSSAPLPATLITAVTRNSIPATGSIFDPSTHSVSMRFTLLSYAYANPLFRYRLDQSRPWNTTSEREVYFAELPPGDYHFEVQGEMTPGVWSRPAVRDFSIRPPWYASSPFKVGAPAALACFIWLGWRRRERVARQIRADLEAAVTERTRSLAAATARAEQESRFKGEFLANMSHEMRTPLNGILGLTRLALEVSAEPEVVRHLNTVHFSANVLLTLINDVLDLAKIEAGMLKIVPVPFAPAILLNEVQAMLAAEAGKKHLKLEIEVDASVPTWISCDDSRLRQILVNLIGNALKFTHQGGVTVRMWHVDDCLHCSVRDTGIGIAPEQQALIFEMFRQADNSTARRYGGSGLGLAISRKLVESMGGIIGIQSEPGIGSTFFFHVQAPPASAPERSATSLAPALPDVPPMRILVAEDNPVNQYLLVALLRKRGHTPVLANNGEEALAAFAREPLDLILMDIQMPGMDGLEAVRIIRQREQALATRLPVVAVTARAMPGDRTEILAAGMDDYLEKPIQSEQLDAILSRFSPVRTPALAL